MVLYACYFYSVSKVGIYSVMHCFFFVFCIEVSYMCFTTGNKIVFYSCASQDVVLSEETGWLKKSQKY